MYINERGREGGQRGTVYNVVFFFNYMYLSTCVLIGYRRVY